MSPRFVQLNLNRNLTFAKANEKVSYSITINRSAKTLSLLKNGNYYRSYPVAVGKKSTPTPTGSFHVINKSLNPGGPYGARWIGINSPGIGIHGTNNPASIGTNASHGCIRMYNKDVIELYNIISIGTPVNIVG